MPFTFEITIQCCMILRYYIIAYLSLPLKISCESNIVHAPFEIVLIHIMWCVYVHVTGTNICKKMMLTFLVLTASVALPFLYLLLMRVNSRVVFLSIKDQHVMYIPVEDEVAVQHHNNILEEIIPVPVNAHL